MYLQTIDVIISKLKRKKIDTTRSIQ